jgi:transcriptional regulator with XRE-family HTH domain
MIERADFDTAAFYLALDATRTSRGLNWKQVAEGAGVSPSMMTRLAQGRRPDVDGLAALIAWSGLNANQFVRLPAGEQLSEPDALSKIAAFVATDSRLSSDSKSAMMGIIAAAYTQLSAKPK